MAKIGQKFANVSKLTIVDIFCQAKFEPYIHMHKIFWLCDFVYRYVHIRLHPIYYSKMFLGFSLLISVTKKKNYVYLNKSNAMEVSMYLVSPRVSSEFQQIGGARGGGW